MSSGSRTQMDSPKPGSLFLRSTSAVSLHERFSQILVDQLTPSRTVTFDPILPVKKEPPSLPGLQMVNQHLRRKRRRRRSIWTQLYGRQVTRHLSAPRRRGFWSFTNKYRWRLRFTSAYRRRGNLWSGFSQLRFLRRTNIQKLTAGPHLSLNLQRGGATASWGRDTSKANIPTRRQLDAQLDEYMSLSKSRLDKQLEDYMSMSRSRLDAQLDEYMSMAGEAELQLD